MGTQTTGSARVILTVLISILLSDKGCAFLCEGAALSKIRLVLFSTKVFVLFKLDLRRALIDYLLLGLSSGPLWATGATNQVPGRQIIRVTAGIWRSEGAQNESG